MIIQKLLGDRILVKPNEPKKISKGGIIIPDPAVEISKQGKVVMIGRIHSKIEIGNEVLYGRAAGVEITLEDGQYLLLKENDIIAIVK